MSQHGCPERVPNVPPGFAEDSPREPTMEVLVETLTGTAFEMTVSPSDTVLAIKTRIFRVEGIPVSQQHLLYNLSELSDECSLRELGISEGARLRLVLGLRGGPISTRRLPQPAAPWPDIERLERLLDTSREDGTFSNGAGGKVTVLVFRDGERVSLLRVRENDDGTYTPVDHPRFSSSLKSLVEDSGDDGLALVAENAVTMGKMLELRRRMEALCVRKAPRGTTDKPDVIQKTRSEETLTRRTVNADADYARYDYDCAFADAYTLLPPIGTRAESEQSVAASLGTLGRGVCLPADANDPDADATPPLPAPPFAAAATADYGPLIVGPGVGWRTRGFGSSSQLTAHPAAPRELSSSTPDLELLQRNRLLPGLSRHRPREHLHLSDEGLDVAKPRNLEVGSERRQRRIQQIQEQGNAAATAGEEPALPTTTKHNTEDAPAPPASKEGKKVRLRCGFCRKRLGAATVHTCRCGAAFCAPHRYAEVHGCLYDYKRPAALALARANPLVSAPKLPKI